MHRKFFAAIGLALCAGTIASAATWPVYDVNAGVRGAANRQMFQGYFDSSANSGFVLDMHEGIDILASGNGGEEVAVVREGVITQNDMDNGGQIFVRVRVGGTDANPIYETDAYLHINNRLGGAAGMVGATVAEGLKLGNISNTHYGAGSRHLHYSVFAGEKTTANIGTADLRNPYLRFTAAADRDPLGNNPALTDTNGDSKKIILVEQGKTNPAAGDWAPLTKTIRNNVDIIADVWDKQHATLRTGAGPHKVGYSVKALFDQGVTKHDIRSPAAPYLLAKFDDAWAPGTPASTVIYADSGADVTPPASVTGQLRVSPNTTIFPESKHYIVTNTSGETGAPANATASHFWRTRAKDDGTGDVANTANGVSMGTAAFNAEGRFKDGDYEINIHMGDVIAAHDTNEIAGKVRVNNFTQTAVPATGGADPPSGPTSSLWNSTTPFLPGHAPSDPEMAPITLEANIGDDIATSGDQYYPNLLMPTYVFVHRSWNDGTFFSDFVTQSLVMSDATGTVDLTRVWNATMLGEFDIIIDYDRNGEFSATLDGLGAFKIVPEPACAAFAVLMVVASGIRRRSRAK